MIYVLCVVAPPLAVLLKGRPVPALVNLFLTLLFWVPGVVHAFLVVNDANADARTRRVVRAIEKRADEVVGVAEPESREFTLSGVPAARRGPFLV